MNIFLKAFKPETAPKALGPYSPAVKLGDFVYLSGQIPLNPETGEVEGTTIEEQTHQVMKNIKAVLNDMGLDYKHIVKTTIFVSDLNDFDKLNEVYGSYLEEPYPARSCVQVARLLWFMNSSWQRSKADAQAVAVAVMEAAATSC